MARRYDGLRRYRSQHSRRIARPDPYYVDEGNNAKWLTFYDQQFERDNPAGVQLQEP